MHLDGLHACFALISSALVCVVVHHSSYRFVVSFSQFAQYISDGSTASADSSDPSFSSAGSTEIPSRSKKYRHVAVHSRKEVVDVDAMSSDACPVRMLSEGEYVVHTSS